MSLSGISTMEIATKSYFKYLPINTGYNFIGDKGIKLLTNNNWQHITAIGLSKTIIMKIVAKFLTLDCLICIKFNGKIFKN